jgi:hypothetical protein
VQRVVKRAAELAMISPAADQAGTALTAAELEQRLAELGIPSEIAKRAMEPAAPAVAPSADGAIRVVREIEIDGMVPAERFEEIADAIASAMKMAGRTSAVGNKLTWTPGGMLLEPSLTVHSKNGRTLVRYVETLANRGQTLIGFGTLAGFAGMIVGTMSSVAGVAIAKGAEISAAQGGPVVLGTGVALGLAAAVGSFIGLKRMLAHRSEVRSRFAEEVLNQVGKAVRECAVSSPTRTRVEAATPGEVVHERDAQAEAEAEAATEAELARSAKA